MKPFWQECEGCRGLGIWSYHDGTGQKLCDYCHGHGFAPTSRGKALADFLEYWYGLKTQSLPLANYAKDWLKENPDQLTANKEITDGESCISPWGRPRTFPFL